MTKRAELIEKAAAIIANDRWGDVISSDEIAIAVIDAIAGEMEPKWLPIESAPKDGTAIWICNQSGYQCESWWDAFHKVWGDVRDEDSPTHWMPLPQSPSTNRKDGA